MIYHKIAPMLVDPMIDSLKIYQRLKAAKVEEKAAKEIASIFSEILETQLATKRDIKDLELKIEQTKVDILKWVIGWNTGLILGLAGFMYVLIKSAK